MIRICVQNGTAYVLVAEANPSLCSEEACINDSGSLRGILLLHSCNSLMFYHTLQGFMGAGATRLIPGTEKWGGYKEDCSL